VDAGGLSTCASKRDRTLWCWGDNSDGQLGLGDKVERTDPRPVGTAPADLVAVGGYASFTLVSG
jgi:alpha-tubulin suppressor-like RCC1 family protein